VANGAGALEGLELMAGLVDRNFWAGRRVLLTGHTGFKGAWAALWLSEMGADVHGLALPPETDPSLFTLVGLDRDMQVGIGDLRDIGFVAETVRRARPEIVLHMAAQPLVRRSVRAPLETFEVNVMGTAHLLEALRAVEGLEAILVVTTDKVYENPETGRAFAETDPLGGHDPYSASKAAAEIVTASFARTYFELRGVPVATARGGNVIGGGDFSADRLVPDVFRAMRANTPLALRNPDATRPWQHVLDCLGGYLAYAQALAKREPMPRAMNFGPLGNANVPVRVLAEAVQQALGAAPGWVGAEGPQAREMQTLSLDCSLARDLLGFRDRLVGHDAIRATADWYLAFARGDDTRAHTLRAIKDHMDR
jgi:CDP-glucose 4,6-dehydratase